MSNNKNRIIFDSNRTFSDTLTTNQSVKSKGVIPMPVEVDQKLYQDAVIEAAQNHITVDEQIELWARVGRTALANPDIPAEAIESILKASKQPTEPFVLGR